MIIKAIMKKRWIIQIKEGLLGKGHVDLIRPYNNLGIVYYYKGDYRKALSYYQKVVDIQQKAQVNNTEGIANTLNNIGMIHTLRGDYSLAIEYFEKSVAMKLELLGENHPDVASPLNSLGVVYYYKKDFEKALYYQNKVLVIKEGHFDENHPFMVTSYNNLGLIHGNTGEYALALEYFEKSLSIQKKTLGEKHSDISLTYRFIGDIHLNSGDYELALEGYQKALALRKQIFGNKHPEVAESYNDVAKIQLLKGDPEAALKNAQRALVSNVLDFQDSTGVSNPGPGNYLKQNFLLTSLKLKAEAFEKISLLGNNTEDLKRSVATFKLCDDLIGQISKNRLQHDDKITFGSISTRIYEKAVEACFSLYEKSSDGAMLRQAYYFSEKSKAGVLRQTLSDNSAKSFGLVPDSLLVFEKQLKMDRSYYQTKMLGSKSKGRDPAEVKDWENKLFDLNRSYDSLVLSFEKNYPEYYELKYRDDIIDINSMPGVLQGQSQAVVEYFLSDSTIFAFIITRDGYHVSSAPLAPEFDSLILGLREGIAERGRKKTEQQYDYATIAHQLYTQLFVPVKPYLSTKIDQITIIPHGALSFVPFGLLLSKAPDKGTNYKGLAYLLKEYEIGYAYSGTLWAKKYRPKKEWEYQFAGYAPSYQTSLLANSKALDTYGEYRDDLADLQFSSDEIQAAAGFFSGTTFVGEAATESLFKKEGGKYQILHLAMHAIVDEDNPLQSKLIFTQNSDSVEDGFLNAYELYNMDLDAELAVLSACNTGYGKLARGEGVMSLGRAFAYAGCPSILMSLWPAQDQATADIMTYFYEGLSAGHSKDKALREAKLKYLENTEDLFAHPFYWAGFVLQGDPRPIAVKAGFDYWWALLGLALVLGVVGLWRSRSKNATL